MEVHPITQIGTALAKNRTALADVEARLRSAEAEAAETVPRLRAELEAAQTEEAIVRQRISREAATRSRKVAEASTRRANRGVYVPGQIVSEPTTHNLVGVPVAAGPIVYLDAAEQLEIREAEGKTAAARTALYEVEERVSWLRTQREGLTSQVEAGESQLRLLNAPRVRARKNNALMDKVGDFLKKFGNEELE